MSRLLSAYFVRLFKNKSFWLCNIFMIILAVVSQFMNWVQAVNYGSDPSPDTTFFFYSLFLGILLSAFISLFIGAEYSSGAMRNKLIIGHSRTAIYLSGLITCIAASALMCLFYLAAALATGLPLSGFFDNVQDSLASLGAGFGSALADIIHLRIPAQPRGAYIRWGIDTRH